MGSLDAGALALADAIAARVSEVLRGPTPEPVIITETRPDEELLAAALKVSEAYTDLDRSKHSRDEIRARLRLERQAKELRALLRTRGDLRHV